MKVRSFKRFSADDFRGSPNWFLDFIDSLNPMIDSLNPLLANNIDIDNNLLAERQSVTVSHGVPVTVTLRSLTAIPRLVRVGYAAGYVGSAAITSYNGDGSVQV